MRRRGGHGYWKGGVEGEGEVRRELLLVDVGVKPAGMP